MLTQNDAPATGEHRISVSLWTAADGGSQLWNDDFTTQLSRGVFNLALGSGKPLPAPTEFDKPLWVSVAIDGGPPAARSQLTSVPIALNVVDEAITTQKLADGAITASKLGTDYVGAIRVNGEQATERGTSINIASAGSFNVRYDVATSTILLGDPLGSFIGNQPAVFLNTDDGTFGPSNPNSTNAVVGGEDNEAWDLPSGSPELAGHDFVGGGFANKSWGKFDAIAGGDTNIITGDTSFIGGGQFNLVNGNFSAIAGGEENLVGGNFGVVVGGLGNRVTPTSIIGGFIGGGDSNKVQVSNGVIAGGHVNFVDGGTTVGGAILGGAYNSVFSTYGAIVGGDSNTIQNKAPESFIGAGHLNTAMAWGHSGVVSGDSNTAYGFGSIVGAGFKNRALGNRSGIVAGLYNQVDSTGPNSVIAGGVVDTIRSDESFIGAGDHNRAIGFGSAVVTGGTSGEGTTGNTAIGEMSVIGGGLSNSSYGNSSFIGAGAHDSVASAGAGIIGGEYNTIKNGSFSSMIGTGYHNIIDSLSWYSMIGTGLSNHIYSSGLSSNSAFIGAGDSNAIYSFASFIGSGSRNRIDSKYEGSFIGGGFFNIMEEYDEDSAWPTSVIVGGASNYLGNSGSASIGGGEGNEMYSSDQSTIGGGEGNSIYGSSEFNTISGGAGNQMWYEGFGHVGPTECVIGGGFLNNIYQLSNDPAEGFSADRSVAATIAGGLANNIFSSSYGVIGGGDSNYIGGSSNTISGGSHNSVGLALISGSHGITGFTHGISVGGGEWNQVWTSLGTISGGDSNAIWTLSDWSTIGGGKFNRIGDFGVWPTEEEEPYAIGLVFGTIAGGDSNIIKQFADFGTIGGGHGNTVSPAGIAATIPGGDSLTASSYAQVVLGYNNVPIGTFTKGTAHDFATSGVVADEPLLIVGNGDEGTQSIAMEVSYDGHITAFDQNGNTNSGGRPPVLGASYTDNTVVAWGDVTPTTVGLDATINADFGVALVTNPSTGVYVVRLKTQLPDGGGATSFMNGSVTVTINDDADSTTAVGSCGYATASHLSSAGGFTTFNVRTYSGSGSAHVCSEADLPFFFKVCARSN